MRKGVRYICVLCQSLKEAETLFNERMDYYFN